MTDTGGPPRPRTDPRLAELRVELARRVEQSGSRYVIGRRPALRIEADPFSQAADPSERESAIG